MFYSVFDYNRLDPLHNLSSVEECMSGIREFAPLGDTYNLELTDKEVCNDWAFAVFSHEKEITENTGTPRTEIENKYNITIIYDY